MTASATYPDEPAFHTAWRDACTDNSNGSSNSNGLLADEVDLALVGGALADRLSWVFVSGYQAAVRRCFPELISGSGWTCLAAAEGRGGPGCELLDDGDDWLLNGEKSWVAGAGVLESLVVSLSEGADRRFVGVEVSAPGVTIDLPRTPGFLAEMTQGVARFDQVRVSGVLEEPARGLWFRGAEPLYVMLALNACLAARGRQAGDEKLVARAELAIEHGRTLPAVLDQKDAILAGLAELRVRTSSALTASAEVVSDSSTLAASWQSDAGLFQMFGLARKESAV